MVECKNLLAIIEELAQDAKQVDNDQLAKIEELILQAKRVFIVGAGRSGFAARAFSSFS